MQKLLFLKIEIAQGSDFEIQIQTSWASREAAPAHRTYFLKAAMAGKTKCEYLHMIKCILHQLNKLVFVNILILLLLLPINIIRD